MILDVCFAILFVNMQIKNKPHMCCN